MSLYEQLKDDLGYLQMGAASERFAPLAEDAQTEGWSHVEYLARVVGEQAAATRGNVNLIWPHSARLVWPHLGRVW